MTSDAPISELELVVLAFASVPRGQDELFAQVQASWTSPLPTPSTPSCFAALMGVREAGLLECPEPTVFATTARGRRLLQRALCGALGAPRSAHRPGSLTFPQALSMADLLPPQTLVTVLRTRLDSLDDEQTALATALRAAHARSREGLHIAALNLREGLLNAERAFLFTFLGDVEDGFASFGGRSLTPSPVPLPVR